MDAHFVLVSKLSIIGVWGLLACVLSIQRDCIALMCVYTTGQPCLRPYTVNFKYAHLNISRKLNVLVHLLGYCQSAALTTVMETAHV